MERIWKKRGGGHGWDQIIHQLYIYWCANGAKGRGTSDLMSSSACPQHAPGVLPHSVKDSGAGLLPTVLGSRTRIHRTSWDKSEHSNSEGHRTAGGLARGWGHWLCFGLLHYCGQTTTLVRLWLSYQQREHTMPCTIWSMGLKEANQTVAVKMLYKLPVPTVNSILPNTWHEAGENPQCCLHAGFNEATVLVCNAKTKACPQKC